MKMQRTFAVTLAAIMGLALVGVAPAAAGPGDVLVNVGSPASPFSQNKQNEPALAVDANHPNILAAGANDEIDMEACNAGADNTCPFTPGVGVSGIYFSFDSGATWTQPTYTGLTGRYCLGTVGDTDAGCMPKQGSIGTLPWYYENGLVADGDPALAFGPVPDSNGHFDWANGSRLYYADLTSKIGEASPKETFKGYEAVAVSRTDDVSSAASDHMDAWMPPVIVSQQSSTTFSDKEQVWADNAASSPYFGNVYVCMASYRSQEKGVALPQPLMVATSTDGGDTWNAQQVTSASNTPFNSKQGFGRSGCTVRTDSQGVVYVFANQFAVGSPGHGAHIMIKSTNGGATWTSPVNIGPAVDTCFGVQFDGFGYRCVMDGIGGARDDLSSAPSVDISNGAPSGSSATNEIVRSWVDGANGVDNPDVLVSYSTDSGNTWSDPAAVQSAGDRGYYSAMAISPSGTDAYLVYNAFTTPYLNDTSSERGLVGVVKHADVGAGGALTGWSDLHRSKTGDPRASAQNNLWLEFLGDYVYAVATDSYGSAVWNDMRNADDCSAIDTWRAAAQVAFANGTDVPPAPAPQQDCGKRSTFGNSDIYGGSYSP
jgi:hypothetical protein